MDTLYSRERAEGDRMTAEERLEEVEIERDELRVEVKDLRKIIRESLDLCDDLRKMIAGTKR
jgi:hypothetical protein